MHREKKHDNCLHTTNNPIRIPPNICWETLYLFIDKNNKKEQHVHKHEYIALMHVIKKKVMGELYIMC